MYPEYQVEANQERRDEIVKAIVGMTEAERNALLGALSEKICLECGGDQPLHGICQCWNDE